MYLIREGFHPGMTESAPRYQKQHAHIPLAHPSTQPITKPNSKQNYMLTA